jgi:hypothetical protein
MTVHRFRDAHGAVVVETALVVGVFLFLMLGIIDLGRIGILKGMLHNAAQLAVRDLKVTQGIDADQGSTRTSAAIVGLDRGRNFLLSALFTDESTIGNSYSALFPDPNPLVSNHVGHLTFPDYANEVVQSESGGEYTDVSPPGRLTHDLATIPVGATFSAQVTPLFFRIFGPVVLTETAYGYVEERQAPSAPIAPGCMNAADCPCPFSIPVPGQPLASWNGTNCLCPNTSIVVNSDPTNFTCGCPNGTSWIDSQDRCLCDNPPTCDYIEATHQNQYVGDDCQCHTCDPTQALNSTDTGCACGWSMGCNPQLGYLYSLWNCACVSCDQMYPGIPSHVNVEGNNCTCDSQPECPTNQYANVSNTGCACANCPTNKVHAAAGLDADDDTCVCAPALSVCPDGTFMDPNDQNCVCQSCQGEQISNSDRTACVCPSTLPACDPTSEIHTGATCDCACAAGSTLINTVDAGEQCVPTADCPNPSKPCEWNNGNPYQPEDP